MPVLIEDPTIGAISAIGDSPLSLKTSSFPTGSNSGRPVINFNPSQLTLTQQTPKQGQGGPSINPAIILAPPTPLPITPAPPEPVESQKTTVNTDESIKTSTQVPTTPIDYTQEQPPAPPAEESQAPDQAPVQNGQTKPGLLDQFNNLDIKFKVGIAVVFAGAIGGAALLLRKKK